MKPLPPEQRVRRWHTYLIVWVVHRVLGLGVGVLILLASLTGGLLVMHHELETLLEHDRRHLGVSSTGADFGLPRQPVAALAAAAAPHAPAAYRPFRYLPGSAPDAADQVMFVSPDGRTRWSAFVNPYTADVRWHGDDQSLLTPWLLGLHMHLHLGGWGYVVTGLGGAGLFFLGLTGLYLHRDRLGALWRRPMRFGRGGRIACSDLHQWLGMASIYFSLVLGLTGLIYCVTIAPAQIAAAKPLAAPFDLNRLTPVEPLLQFARTRFPEGTIQRVSFPGTATSPLTILILERSAPVWRKFSRIDFDPVTGQVRAVRDARQATTREKFAALLAPLHMGIHGSTLVKWLYVIGGFSPAVLAATGTAIWWLRTRKAAARPAPPHAKPQAVSSPA